MPRFALLAAALLAAAAAAARPAYDSYLKLDSFFLAPGDTLRAPLLQGSFTGSEGSIGLERVRDLELLDTGVVRYPALFGWDVSRDTTVVGIIFKREGTYVLGLEMHPFERTFSAAEFNAYLNAEGLTAILDRRRKLGQLSRRATERTTRAVKAVFQVGERRTATVSAPFRFAAEIVPVDNPYVGQRSGTLRMQCLVDGKPAPGLVVFAGSQLGHETPVQSRFVSDANGIVTLHITRRGRWYVRFVRMVPAKGGADYESQSTTLTFAVR